MIKEKIKKTEEDDHAVSQVEVPDSFNDLMEKYYQGGGGSKMKIKQAKELEALKKKQKNLNTESLAGSQPSNEEEVSNADNVSN